MLQILDALRYIKKIPDATIESSCKRLLSIIENLTDKDRGTMVRLALKYPPATRALLGALLEELKDNSITESLYRSLNPITTYKLKGVASALRTAAKWNIV